MDAYHILERIGEGSFGKVYRGRRKFSGHIVALKFVTKRGKNARDLQNLRDEINILRRLNHCNIIAMLDSFETEGEFCMVTEYAQGDLFQILEDDRQLPEDEIRKISIQLTQALHVLHANRIIHRDMKPQNILIGAKQQIKLCDFGFARAIAHDTSLLTSIKGTPLYMAPELMRQQPYNYTVDLWSLGVILYELAVGRPPFYTERIVSLIEMIVREPVQYPPTMSPDFQSFLAGLLNKDPSKRMTWPEILAHPFVKETAEQHQARIVLESQQALAVLETLPAVCGSATLRQAGTSLLQIQYRALVGFLKAIDRPSTISSVLTAREKTHKVLRALLADRASAKEVTEEDSEIIYQAVRCCMMFTTIINASNTAIDSEEHVNFREIYKSDVRAVNALLNLKGVSLFSAHSKTLKWLGSMLDRSKNLSLFLEQVHPSGVVETLCAILQASGNSRSPGGRITKGGRDLGLYAAFALSTFVHPDGESWGPLQPFPIVALMTDSNKYEDRSRTVDVKLLAKLRSKVHFEVITQLLKSGLVELVALLWGELKERTIKDTSSNNIGELDEDDNEGDEDEDDDQSSVCCILKVLLHGCRSSIPLTKKLPTIQVTDRPGSANDIVSILLGGVASKSLRSVELYFAVELLAAILHRGALSKIQVWQCSKRLYPLLCESSDVALLSALSNFLAHAIETGGVDETVFAAAEEQDANFGEREEELWHCLAHGYLPERCADAVFRLFDHEQLSESHESLRNTKLQMLTCYNIRAQGLIDAGVVLLLRVASKAGKQPPQATSSQSHDEPGDVKSIEMQSFIAAFRQNRAWATVSKLLQRGGSDILSPWGLFCFLKLMRVVREVQCHDPHMEAAINESLIPYLVNLLELKHIAYLFEWPDVSGGGSNAVKALVHAVVKVLGIPFMHGVSEELVVGTQEVLYDVECVQKLLGVLRFVFSTKEFHLETSVLELPMSFLSRLVTSSEHFGVQLVRADGMRVIKECGMLQSECSPSLIIDTVLIVSQLARSSQENYNCILQANLLPEFHSLIQHRESMVRAKALNCIGNLCRHSTLFYEQLVSPMAGSPTLLDGIIRSLEDPDSYVRRFACFAIGNAAFHNNALYRALRPSIQLLIQNLQDPEEKTRSNAGGALGNLVRNSDELCAELCSYQAPLELFELAMTDPSISSRRIVLFSLGNFCLYPQCYTSLLDAEPEFLSHLERLHDEIDSDEVSKKNIRRILAKIDGLEILGGGARVGYA